MGLLKKRTRFAINLKLNQIKESTRRSEAIKSVLEYTKSAWKEQIVGDLKKLEKEIKINNLEKSLRNGKKLLSSFFTCFKKN